MDAPPLRLATLADAEAIETLMQASIADLFPAFYDARQTQSSIQHIGVADRVLIDDATYFVAEASRELVACGGWSRRDKLYTGSGASGSDLRVLDPLTEPARVRAMFVRSDWTRRGLGRRILEACEAAAKADGYRTLALMATLPGVPLYTNYGFRERGRTAVTMPDGVSIACLAMEKPVG
ncbi:MAG: GNAT family N-acetyltransferase [Chloroflexota bacterium]|nr:GNAT family N-acetyltransferase [Chloroflexota bacterium]